MPTFNLTPVETRILGCLLEKERTTPENYPLSQNAVVLACNQSTNRDPVVTYDDRTVEDALFSLREKKLATVIFGAGSRVQKYRHNLLDHYELDAREVALLCVLLLRGPQTPGELRTRTERMQPFASLADVEARLDELARGDAPLVQVLPARPGQKEKRYVQLFSADPLAEEESRAGNPGTVTPRVRTAESQARMERLEADLGSLRSELQQLREEFAAFRKQFE